MHALNVVLRVHDLCKLIYNSTFFFKLLPQLFQNIQACLFNIDLNTKLRTRLDKKIVLMSINYGIVESFTCIWTGIAYRSTIYSIYFLFLIVYHNWKHAKFSIPLKYKVLSKHKCCPLPIFLCSWDQRLRVVGYCFSPVCPLTFLISFEGKMFEILFFGVNVDTLKGM